MTRKGFIRRKIRPTNQPTNQPTGVVICVNDPIGQICIFEKLFLLNRDI